MKTLILALVVSLELCGPITALSMGSRRPVKQPTPVEQPKPEVEIAVPSQPSQTPNVGNIGMGSTYEGLPKPFPSATGFFTVKIQTENCDAKQNKKVEEAEKILTAIVNSKEYEQEVLNFSYDGLKQFNWNEGMTNAMIYDHLIRGAEALQPIMDYEMDITMVCYYSRGSTVGYTTPSTMKIYANMKFHSEYDSVDVASNTFHEWTHKMGFDHSVKWNSARDFTVPYGHNKIVRKLGPLAVQGKLTAK